MFLITRYSLDIQKQKNEPRKFEVSFLSRDSIDPNTTEESLSEQSLSGASEASTAILETSDDEQCQLERSTIISVESFLHEKVEV